MGASLTKSPLERRNTIARRSQRRSLANLKPKIDNIYKEIKKFKGSTADQHYTKIKQDIETLKNELQRRSKDLQPQVRNQFENVYKRICEAEMALEAKVEENREREEKKNQKKEEEKTKEVEASSVVANGEAAEVTSTVGSQEIVELHEEPPKSERRKSVQLKLVRVASEEALDNPPKSVSSPIDKRKSILKVGIPVMPGAILSELNQSSRMTRFYDDEIEKEPEQNPSDKIQAIINKLGDVEIEISKFIGQRNGNQYNKIKNTLDQYSSEINDINAADEYLAEQLGRCRNYIMSCMNFLNEKATSSDKRNYIGEDDVFENNNVKSTATLQRLLKNTPV